MIEWSDGHPYGVVLPDHATMVANIVAAYRRASTGTRDEGRAWYPAAQRAVQGIAADQGVDPARVAFCLSALSPRNPWLWNVADTYHFVVAHKAGGPMPSATTFLRNREKAWKALGQDEHPWTSAAPKVTAFVKAVNGIEDAVVVDTWAARAALNGGFARAGRGFASFRPAQYEAFVAAYREAALTVGETPRDLQAIVWLQVQSEGLGTERTGRHDLAFKAGTPAFVKDLLKGAAA